MSFKRFNVDSSGSLSSVTRRLIEALYDLDMIIMLDEASGLRVKQLDQLRQVIAVKSRCPLILAGNHDLLVTVQQDTRRGCESLDQFTSRLTGIVDLDSEAGGEDVMDP